MRNTERFNSLDTMDGFDFEISKLITSVGDLSQVSASSTSMKIPNSTPPGELNEDLQKSLTHLFTCRDNRQSDIASSWVRVNLDRIINGFG
jgi:hypothetical protein